MKLKSGEAVFDRPNSHFHDNDADFSRALGQALTYVESAGREFIEEEVYLGRFIGQSTCVSTDANDEIIYAQRTGRTGLTRFVKNHLPEDCNYMVLVLKKAKKGDGYILITAFIGRLSFPEPWDENAFSKHEDPDRARKDSIDFWSSHALIWETEEIIPGTETLICPW
ncbi:MAG: hypothetical protein PHZ07_00380 [Patescibacteria group bacterium]|nr:hypothetical protein [Patescibacteria group bacterium]MDD4304179.1 hypothetical protein [Patescibacteria group bacterium]MDD4695211.1 hypothetical protein [Patescibacteria group bacterium]